MATVAYALFAWVSLFGVGPSHEAVDASNPSVASSDSVARASATHESSDESSREVSSALARGVDPFHVVRCVDPNAIDEDDTCDLIPTGATVHASHESREQGEVETKPESETFESIESLAILLALFDRAFETTSQTRPPEADTPRHQSALASVRRPRGPPVV
ncbi:MAG: hypothetical protein H6722_15230 [Sandaracinus sp.]|nr:hypothetical protein [Sandaracinus sp.]MCB9613795.1 hypothetical protein [Sandaracinus sp.]MCB9619875.1 hypothetical protein [Sandaracinus sp.]